MGEKMGFMTVILIFGIGVLPLLFSAFTSHVTTGKLLTISTEMQQLVSAEGGVTEKVNNEVQGLEDSGFEITFTDNGGNPVNSQVTVGETIYINYSIKDFETSNQVLITKR